MRKPSELLAGAEAKLSGKLSARFPKLKTRWKSYIPLVLAVWYFYGMLVNSVRLGIRSTFGDGEPPARVWIASPFKNLLAVFTIEGVVIAAVGFLLVCLITKKGTYGSPATNSRATREALTSCPTLRTAARAL
jgi:type IV secretion system protein VirD4